MESYSKAKNDTLWSPTEQNCQSVNSSKLQKDKSRQEMDKVKTEEANPCHVAYNTAATPDSGHTITFQTLTVI